MLNTRTTAQCFICTDAAVVAEERRRKLVSVLTGRGGCRPIKKEGSLEEQLVGGKLPHYTKAATVLIRGRKRGVVYWRRCCVGTPTPGDLQQQQS